MTCGEFGRWANEKNILSQCSRFLLKTEEARIVINDMTQIVETNWYKVMRGEGVSERDAEYLEGHSFIPDFQ